MILGTAGHIDHGKTTLVRALTGVDTDRLPEERRRGITIELGFAPLALDDGRVLGVVDVPGHEAFVRTMVAGSAGVDLALLIVAADEGVMPQTREHLAILELLGIERGVVALTKCDLVDAEWLALVADDVAAVLRDSVLAGAPVIATAAPTGQGIAELRAALAAAAGGVAERGADDLFRLPVDRAFSVKGTGTVVTGTIWSGSVHRDQAVQLFPGGASVRVRGVQSHGRAVAVAPPRSRTALALVGVEPADVGRGSTLVSGAGWAPTRALRADVRLLADAPVVGPRTQLRLHLGTAEVGARVVAAGAPLRPGARVPARVVLDEPLVARAGDRFVLRGGPRGGTLGGGTVADPLPGGRRPRPWPACDLPAGERLRLAAAEAGGKGVARDSLPVRLGVRPAEVPGLLAGAGGLRVLAARVYATAVVDRLAARLLALLQEWHAASPLEEGLSLQTLRARLAVPDELMAALLADAVEIGSISVTRGTAAQAGWAPILSAAQDALAARLVAELEAAGEDPPSTDELVARHGAGVPDLLRLLERRGAVVVLGGERCWAAGALAGVMQRLVEQMEPGRVYAPAELREALGLPRRLLIPVLEHADRTGVTGREGDGRVRRER